VKPVLSPQQAVELDRRSQAGGLPAEVLMERAGRAVAQAAADTCGGVYGRRAVVICGKGNNGGDGFVAARLLARWGMRVCVVSVEALDELREPAATNATRLREVGLTAIPFSTSSLARELDRADIAIDAIFGTGFQGVPEDEWAAAIETLNVSSPPVVAVDIPSGVDGATGAVEGEAVWAGITVTFGAAKIGAVLLPGAERAGTIRVVDIGFDAEAMKSDVSVVEPSDVAAMLPRRAVDTHKRASGVVVVVAGSRNMTGAPSLIAAAAGRVGAGLVVLAVPASVVTVVQTHTTEAVFLPLPETDQGTVAEEALGPLLAALDRADALALGPGLTQLAETAAFVRSLLRESPVPVVLDADGLNAFTSRAREIADRKADAILTPHQGEFERLTGLGSRELAHDQIGAVKGLALDSGAVALLKGPRTLVATPPGQVRINLTGSPVLATAGSGDVLTGVIAGLLARGLEPADAASVGAYLHGEAGRLAGRRLGEGTLAGDIAFHLSKAIGRVTDR
jgi:ADP-dependent NAD(P)H-hydrate dehydratase / NAD(P)H-hydrate epimerase